MKGGALPAPLHTGMASLAAPPFIAPLVCSRRRGVSSTPLQKDTAIHAGNVPSPIAREMPVLPVTQNCVEHFNLKFESLSRLLAVALGQEDGPARSMPAWCCRDAQQPDERSLEAQRAEAEQCDSERGHQRHRSSGARLRRSSESTGHRRSESTGHRGSEIHGDRDRGGSSSSSRRSTWESLSRGSGAREGLRSGMERHARVAPRQRDSAATHAEQGMSTSSPPASLTQWIPPPGVQALTAHLRRKTISTQTPSWRPHAPAQVPRSQAVSEACSSTASVHRLRGTRGRSAPTAVRRAAASHRRRVPTSRRPSARPPSTGACCNCARLAQPQPCCAATAMLPPEPCSAVSPAYLWEGPHAAAMLTAPSRSVAVPAATLGPTAPPPPPPLAPSHSTPPPPPSGPSEPVIAAAAEAPGTDPLLFSPNPDLVTQELERLVEETHQNLVTDGLIQADASLATSTIYAGAMPSLDAVDQALEELRRGLEEIDSTIAVGSQTGCNYLARSG
mmetsp:Transcript_110218/g.322567  ORF Transcript_110218/g.322567 Transcript_110218/m.322567 type:complete len:504 (+) Transcript_110218:1-1512(+)